LTDSSLLTKNFHMLQTLHIKVQLQFIGLWSDFWKILQKIKSTHTVNVKTNKIEEKKILLFEMAKRQAYSFSSFLY